MLPSNFFEKYFFQFCCHRKLYFVAYISLPFNFERDEINNKFYKYSYFLVQYF